MFNKDSASAGIKGVVSGVKDIVGGGVISGVGKAIDGLADMFGLGGVPESVKEEGRALAAKFISGGPNATSINLNDATIRNRFGFPAPTAKGEFYLWRQTGEVYAVTSYGGMVLYSDPWAASVKKIWLTEWTRKDGKDVRKSGPLQASFGGGGMLIPLGILAAVMTMKK